MPLSCEFLGFVNVTHTNFRKPDQQDEEQSPRFTNEVKTALNNEYKEHYLILDEHQFRATIKKMEYQVIKQKRIDLTFSATIDPISEAEAMTLLRMLSGWAKCRIDHDPDLFTEEEREAAEGLSRMLKEDGGDGNLQTAMGLGE